MILYTRCEAACPCPCTAHSGRDHSGRDHSGQGITPEGEAVGLRLRCCESPSRLHTHGDESSRRTSQNRKNNTDHRGALGAMKSRRGMCARENSARYNQPFSGAFASGSARAVLPCPCLLCSSPRQLSRFPPLCYRPCYRISCFITVFVTAADRQRYTGPSRHRRASRPLATRRRG